RVFVRGGCSRCGPAVKSLPVFGEGGAVGAGWGQTRHGERSPPDLAELVIGPAERRTRWLGHPPRRRGGFYFTPIIPASVSMKSRSLLFSCGRANARKAGEPLRSIDISSSLVLSPTFC